ncbi:MAG: hypothetical protein V5A88_03420 [Candidatus Thermoplasmatota archaeon]
MITKPPKVYLVIALLLLIISLSFIPASINGGPQVDISADLTEKRPTLIGNVTDDGIKLKWDFSIGEEKFEEFRIYRSLTSSFKSLFKKFEVEENGYEFLDTDVEEGRTYHYWVTARSEEGEVSRFSEGLEIRMEGENVPLPPKNLEAFPGDEKVILKWDKPLDYGVSDDVDLENYILYREKEGKEMQPVYPGNAATEWLDDELENQKEYTYHLKAQNPVGKSEPTEKISFTPTSDLPKPAPPENLKVFSGENASELAWDPPEDEEHIFEYRIYKDGEAFRDVDKHTTYFIDRDVSEGKTYNYSIRSVNVDGNESAPTGEVRVTISAQDSMNHSRYLRVEEMDQKVKLTWETQGSSEENRGYNIYRGSAEDDLKFIAHVKSTSEFIDEELENERVYYYRVRTVDMNNTLGESTETRHAVPMEQEEDHLSIRTIGAFVVIMAIGILTIIVFLRRREPKGPQVKMEDKSSDS